MKKKQSKQNTQELDPKAIKEAFNIDPPKVYRHESQSSSVSRSNNTNRNKKTASNRSKNKSIPQKKKTAQGKGQRGTTQQTPKREAPRNSSRYDYIEPPQRASRQKPANYNNQTKSQRRAHQNHKRKKKNKLRKVFLGVVVLALIVCVGVVLSLTVFFPIEKIEVSGNKIYTKEQITQFSGIDLDDNLFLVNKEKTSAALEKQLPYVYSVQIKRSIPGTVSIKIVEAKESFAIQNNEKYILLDDNLKVLKKDSDSRPEKTVLITNCEVKQSENGSTVVFKDTEAGERIKALSQVVKKYKIENVTAISSKNINENKLVYDNRITFNFGTLDSMETKVYQGLASLEQLEKTNPQAKGELTISGDKAIYFTEEE